MGREKNAENIPFLRSTQPKSTERVPVVELSGYDPGLPVTAVNLDEFEPDDQLIIQQILEPTILDSQNHITHIGSVILAKVNK